MVTKGEKIKKTERKSAENLNSATIRLTKIIEKVRTQCIKITRTSSSTALDQICFIITH